MDLGTEKQILTFIDSLYRSQEGFVYSPSFQREQNAWATQFFEWPRQRREILKYILENFNSKDIFIGPALYKSPTGGPVKENILGSFSVWAEFDGKPPYYNGIPAPGMLVQSSSKNHLHVYWPLREFLTDIEQLERINKALAYNLGADNSGWDATQILRPPCTINHKRHVPVSPPIIVPSYTALPVGVFQSVQVPAEFDADVRLQGLPELYEAQMDVRWDVLSESAKRLYRERAIPEGKRSSSLMSLGYYLAEAGASIEQMFVLLLDADNRWGKFKGRKDQSQRLLDLIKRARIKYPLNTGVFDLQVKTWTYSEILNYKSDVEWVVSDLLTKKGFMVLTGPPGVGKTQLTLQFSIGIATGESVLGYNITCPQKIAVLSLEMDEDGLNTFLMKINKAVTDEQRKLLEENLIFFPVGSPLAIDTPEGQEVFTNLIKDQGFDGIVIDSLGMVTEGSLNDDLKVKKATGFLAKLQKAGMFIWMIHHQRKAQVQNKKPNTLSDVYGSQYITTPATNVTVLWPEQDQLEVTSLKARFAQQHNPYFIRRDKETLTFSKVVDDLNITREKPEEPPSESDSPMGLE